MDALVAATSSDDAFAELHTDVLGRNIAQVSAGSRYNENPQNYALSVFGRSIRESNCDCDRSQEPSLLQTVFLQNDSYIYDLIDRGRGGWINQLASDLKLRQTRISNPGRGGGNNTARQITSLQTQLKKTKDLLKKAEKQKNERAIEQGKRRIADFRKRLEDLGVGGSKEGAPGIAQKAEPEQVEQAVRATYLRTLSREPKPQELEKAVAYIQSSEDHLNGVRDVLWALINTKEFIVNH